MWKTCILSAALLIGLSAGPVAADEPREQPEQPEQPVAEANRLPAAESPTERRRDEPRPALIDDMHRRLSELRRLRQRLRQDGANEERLADVDRQLHNTEREIAEVSRRGGPQPRREDEPRPPQPPRPPREHAEALGRIEHLHRAAEHLDQAGMREIAEQVRRHAGEMEHQLRSAPVRDPHAEGAHVLREVHEQVEGLRRELNELREQIHQLRGDR